MNHSELSHMAGAVDDSTINIVEVIIIIIIPKHMFKQNVKRYIGSASAIVPSFPRLENIVATAKNCYFWTPKNLGP